MSGCVDLRACVGAHVRALGGLRRGWGSLNALTCAPARGRARESVDLTTPRGPLRGRLPGALTAGGPGSHTLSHLALHFDLQAHSTHSDGTLSPAQVVERAAHAGVELLALTDHDTVGGVQEAIDAGLHAGITVVPAVEISSIDDTEGRELHILGYLIDHSSPSFQTTLSRFLSDREDRTLRMADGLRELGLELDDREIQARREQGLPIGRPHLAEALLRHPSNAQRLTDERIDDIGSAIRAYLIEGRPAFRLRQTPTVAEAIDAIHAAGGLAVWAHPFWDISEPHTVLSTIDRFHSLGIDGVEAFYITHTQDQTNLLASHCNDLSLLTTCSADFHGPDNRQFSRFLAFHTYDLQPNLGPIATRAARSSI